MRKPFLLSLLVALLTTLTLHAYDFQSGDLYYNITSDTTVEVTYQELWSESNYQGLTTATIPETVTNNGTTYSVTSIGGGAFEYCSSLTSITIPNSVISIGNDAFSGCSYLTSIVVESGNTMYDSRENCNAIIETATNTLISGCQSTTIPNSVTSIGSSAFAWCSSLTSITLPNSVTSIGDYAFDNCSSFTSLTIPNSVTSIGSDAFWGCSSLTSIVVESGNTMYDSRENCNAIIETASNTLIAGCQSTTIPNSVTSIGRSAFSGCSSLTSVTIPNSVTTIGDYVFYGCSSLTSITLPNSVTSIGSNAFYDVLNIVYSGTATGSPWGARSVNGYVEGYLVYADDAKTTLLACSAAATGEITIPNSVTSIGQSAFWDCSSLTSITLPNSVTSIGSNAFYDCSSLTSITLPNSVTSIGESAFSRCWALTSIVVESGNTVYDSRENCNAIIETASNTLIAGCQSTTIPNSVTSIGSDAFWDCSSLTSITIGNSVTSIGDYAFAYCSSLTSITCLATTPPTCGNYCFYTVPRTIPIYVPAESVEEYKAADTWKEFDVQALLSTDATETDSDKGATKLLRDGQVLILRDGETYDMTGQRL